jgi:hypothetical protein
MKASGKSLCPEPLKNRHNSAELLELPARRAPNCQTRHTTAKKCHDHDHDHDHDYCQLYSNCQQILEPCLQRGLRAASCSGAKALDVRRIPPSTTQKNTSRGG